MLEQRTKEWFDARKGRVTASSVGAILGVDPNRNQEDVLRMMVRAHHGAETEFKGNPATEWGTANEDTARGFYEMDTGYKVEPAFFDTYKDALGASPDGYVGEDGLVEIKCPYGKRDIEDESEFLSIADQPHYYAQMQIQMLCSRRAWCDFYQWAPKAQKLERVHFDLEWVKENAPKLRAFHDLYLSEIDNPRHLEPLDTRKIVDDEYAISIVKEYHALKEQAKVLEAEAAKLLEKLSADYGESEIGGHKLTFVERKGSIAYAKVIKDHLKDVDLEPYRGKSSSYWRLS